MISPEQLITELSIQNEKLKEELEITKRDIRDFEVLAIEWKKGYDEMKNKYSIKVMELEQIVKELESDIEDLKDGSDS